METDRIKPLQQVSFIYLFYFHRGRSRERSPDENHFFVLVDANEGPESHVGYNLSDLSEQAVNTATNIRNSAGLH